MLGEMYSRQYLRLLMRLAHAFILKDNEAHGGWLGVCGVARAMLYTMMTLVFVLYVSVMGDKRVAKDAVSVGRGSAAGPR